MGKVTTYGYSDRGGRKENEDSGGVYVYSDRIIAVVADGLGGQGDGSIASATALQELAKCGRQGALPCQEELSEAFHRANQAILMKQQNQYHMKTTAVYLCIHGTHAIWAHVGDSRLYHFYKGEMRHVTCDHSIPQLAVLMGEIARRDIPRHPQRSHLMKALGCEDIRPEIHEPVLLEPGKHVFLLCTDGFWEYLEEEELAQSADRYESAEEWIALLRGKMQKRFCADHDNNTAMAIFAEM